MLVRRKKRENDMNNYELAAKLTILDAIEKGHVLKTDIIEYMRSEVYIKSVESYARVIKAGAICER